MNISGKENIFKIFSIVLKVSKISIIQKGIEI